MKNRHLKKRTQILAVSLLVVSSFFVFFEALAATTTTPDSLWNTIKGGSPDTSYANQGAIAGDTYGDYRTLARFTIPGSLGTINSVSVIYHQNATTNNSGSPAVNVYPLTQTGWTTNATWNKYDGSVAWSSPGGDFGSSLGSAVQTGAGADLVIGLSGVYTSGQTLDLITKYANESTATGNYGNFDTAILSIDYTSSTSSPGSDTATSTIEQVQTNMFYGFILFFLSAGGVIGYFQKRFKIM